MPLTKIHVHLLCQGTISSHPQAEHLCNRWNDTIMLAEGSEWYKADAIGEIARHLVRHCQSQAPQPQNFVNSPGYQAWYQSFVDYLKALKTQTHEERMVSSLRMLPSEAESSRNARERREKSRALLWLACTNIGALRRYLKALVGASFQALHDLEACCSDQS